MNVHEDFFKELRIKTFLIQFYVPLTRGKFKTEELEKIQELVNQNIVRLELMKPPMFQWDGRYDLVVEQIFQSGDVLEKAKSFLPLVQKADDEAIAVYMRSNQEHHIIGIDLLSLSKLFDIERLFRTGHMLHERFLGYQEEHLMSFYTICLDYVHSAAHFYNEGYDYLHGKKEIKFYDQIPQHEIGAFEMRRIQPKEEVMFRNFREAFVNIILFIESFINCVGYDAYLAELAQSPADRLKLQGIQGQRKNGKYNYSTMHDKLINITRIVGGKEIDTDIEPFLSYEKSDVELRNMHLHSKLMSQQILLDHHGWKNKCDEYIDHKCFDVINSFWKACYPAKPFPVHIFNVFSGNSFKGHQGKYMAEPKS